MRPCWQQKFVDTDHRLIRMAKARKESEGGEDDREGAGYIGTRWLKGRTSEEMSGEVANVRRNAQQYKRMQLVKQKTEPIEI